MSENKHTMSDLYSMQAAPLSVKTKYVVGSKWNLTIPRLVDYSTLGETKRAAHDVRHCEVAGAYSYHVLFVDSKGIKHSYTYRELEQMESKGRIEEVKI